MVPFDNGNGTDDDEGDEVVNDQVPVGVVVPELLDNGDKDVI